MSAAGVDERSDERQTLASIVQTLAPAIETLRRAVEVLSRIGTPASAVAVRDGDTWYVAVTYQSGGVSDCTLAVADHPDPTTFGEVYPDLAPMVWTPVKGRPVKWDGVMPSVALRA